MSADIAIVGLAVMGENLALNFESRGYTVAVFNRTVSKVDAFVNGRGKGKKFVATHSAEELAKALKKPRKIMLMVQAGDPVDQTIQHLQPHLEKDDIIIDGGNSHFPDTTRRAKALAQHGLHFIGCGVSGGEEGALHGPSIMPGGSPAAWPHVKPLLQAIAAKVDNMPCCDWVGEEGAGHFVKMVHNGIEYGDMQLISEAYFLLKHVLHMNNDELAKTFAEWNSGDLGSYLVEITADIFKKPDDVDSSARLIDKILDAAGQKGTGKWTVNAALDLGMPLTLISEAVFARALSALKNERTHNATVLHGPQQAPVTGAERQRLIEAIRDALYASKIVSYAQGFVMFRAAAAEYKWSLNLGSIAMMWRGGCIIRSVFLSKIAEAFDRNPQLSNLLLDPYFTGHVHRVQPNWRLTASAAVLHGVPAPAITSALSYFDGIRAAQLPANLIQAQRDYFGAHQFERVDKPRGHFFHADWTGHGGSTASSTYNV